jgi:hypothetical protein
MPERTPDCTSALQHRLAELLEEVVGGQLKVSDALMKVAQWPDIPSQRLDVGDALSTLMHMHIYKDMRAKSTEYNENLQNRLRFHIAELRNS